VDREKYSELKLQATFLKASPGYLLTSAANSSSTGVYNTNSDVLTTPLFGSNGSFFIVRHSDYTSQASSNYVSIILLLLRIPVLSCFGMFQNASLQDP
jgi:hypothetical protein